jgi:hypothetical protein
MKPPHQGPGPSLELIFETIHGFQRTGAVKAALELDVFTGIADGANTALTLARRAGASARGMRILCDYLVVIGLLTKTADRYVDARLAGVPQQEISSLRRCRDRLSTLTAAG